MKSPNRANEYIEQMVNVALANEPHKSDLWIAETARLAAGRLGCTEQEMTIVCEVAHVAACDMFTGFEAESDVSKRPAESPGLVDSLEAGQY